MPRLQSPSGRFINSMNPAHVVGAAMANAATQMTVQDAKAMKHTMNDALVNAARDAQDKAQHSTTGGNVGGSPSNPGGPTGFGAQRMKGMIQK